MATAGTAFAAPSASTPSPIESTQDPSVGPDFVGTPAEAQPLDPAPTIQPEVGTLHGDGGNTKAFNGPGPLGSDLQVSSASMEPTVFLWSPDGRLTGTESPLLSSKPGSAVTALDPKTMAEKARWEAPEGQTLNVYVSQRADGTVLASSREGQITVLKREDTADETTFTEQKTYDLAAVGLLEDGQGLLATAFDETGNIWFTLGGVGNLDQSTVTSTKLGYLDGEGKAHALDVEGQRVENGMAVQGNTVYVNTSPAGTSDHADAEGYFYALTAGTGESPEVLWRQTYDAGDDSKPPHFSRGSGTSPTLLGDRYVAITDNADDQVNVEVYRQEPAGEGESQRVCSVPVGGENPSGVDNAMVGYVDGGTSSLLVQNTYGGPSFYQGDDDIDGSWNDMSAMPGGMQRIDISDDGTCSIKWNNADKLKAIPVLSTETGLVYGYGQEPDLAADGTYVWYAEAIDFRTGETVWKKRVGAGGHYNDNWQIGSLGPDGTFYQTVEDGVVTFRDGDSAS
ncbi:hypothetical protein [Streptomyces sp. NPDC046862]|uniref:hypothetical protein n=1 Tax=Streptomyces sp. NPDC046862 TaxID=3154603 RepID=UPI00345576BF